jgi:hypothetical protein
VKIKSRLGAYLKGRNLTSGEAAKMTGLTATQIEHLCQEDHGRNWAIQVRTMEKILSGLGLPPERWLVVEDPDFRHLIADTGGPVTIIMGTHPVALISDASATTVLLQPGVRREAVEIWDIRALTEVLSHCPGDNSRFEQMASTLRLPESEVGKLVPPLTALSTKGVVISLGSPLCSGFADFALVQILAQGWTLPFSFHWSFDNPGSRRYQKCGLRDRQGIHWNGKLYPVPLWKEIRSSRKDNYNDGAVIVLQPAPEGRGWWLLVMGFMGPATKSAAAFVWTDKFAAVLAEYRKYLLELREDAGDRLPLPPLFVLLRVPCIKPQGDVTVGHEVEPGKAELLEFAYRPTSAPTRIAKGRHLPLR